MDDRKDLTPSINDSNSSPVLDDKDLPTVSVEEGDVDKVVNNVPPRSDHRFIKIVVLCSVLFIVVVTILMILYVKYIHNTTVNKPKLATAVARFTVKTVPFKVLSTTPSVNQSNVSPSSTINITFSQSVNAKKLQGNLFVTPAVTGTFSQGSSADQAIFTPSTTLSAGTKFQVMINGTYQSSSGEQLGAAYVYGFTTALLNNTVTFQDKSDYYNGILSSAQSGKTLSYSLSFGSGVQQASVTLYKGNVNDLLSSLVYSPSSGNNPAYFIGNPIDTAGMQVINIDKNLANGGTYTVSQNSSGLYLAVATDNVGNQLGHVWINYSNFAVIAREDDQKIIAYGQSLVNNSSVDLTSKIYNLQNGVNLLSQENINGLTTITAPYSPSSDVIVASDGTDYAIVPLSVVDSEGDIRVHQNLSNAMSIYGVTDRPTYSINDTVNFSGFAQYNNDAAYTPVSNTTIPMYVSNYQGGTKFDSFNVTTNSSGVFSGSFTTNPNWLSGNNNTQLSVYAVSTDGISYDDVQVASFTISNTQVTKSRIVVEFSQPSYLPNQVIQAKIVATDSNGNPASNSKVDVHTYTSSYYENDPTLNYNQYGSPGSEVQGSPSVIQLNAQGVAIYTVNVSDLPNNGTSQKVTVQANFDGDTSGIAGGASATIHQGNGYITFGSFDTVVTPNTPLISRMYIYDLNGNPIPNAPVGYSLVDNLKNNQVVATGTVTADANGYAVVDIPSLTNVSNNDYLTLNVWTTDSYNNKIQNQVDYTYYNSIGSNTSGATLSNLDVFGAPSTLNLGETVNLTINSPANITALVTMDRNRIYNPQIIQLSKGSNSFAFKVSPQLVPSFTLTFNYIENGIYYSEGVHYFVQDPALQANISISINNGGSVVANSTSQAQITVTDNNKKPISTNLIVSIVSANAYDLYSQVNPSMYLSFFRDFPIMTSSSSSLLGIGSGGIGCGGGAGYTDNFVNPVGTTLLWKPNITTNSLGQATISFTPPAGNYRINIYSMSGNNIVGSNDALFNAISSISI